MSPRSPAATTHSIVRRVPFFFSAFRESEQFASSDSEFFNFPLDDRRHVHDAAIGEGIQDLVAVLPVHFLPIAVFQCDLDRDIGLKLHLVAHFALSSPDTRKACALIREPCLISVCFLVFVGSSVNDSRGAHGSSNPRSRRPADKAEAVPKRLGRRYRPTVFGTAGQSTRLHGPASKSTGNAVFPGLIGTSASPSAETGHATKIIALVRRFSRPRLT